MAFSYTKKRTGQHYAEQREPVPDIPAFKLISKLIFVSSMLLTLISFWANSSFLLTIYQYPLLQLAGTFLVLTGFINLQLAFQHLGEQYSPSFDAYLPTILVTSGHYRFIRHPIYLFNLFVSFGLAIASGSAIVYTTASIALLFILKIINMEEKCLIKHFPRYQTYQKQSWRLVPFCY
jgi:protein-S-isoprenylcysteine O-methyltransferase Ste14